MQNHYNIQLKFEIISASYSWIVSSKQFKHNIYIFRMYISVIYRLKYLSTKDFYIGKTEGVVCTTGLLLSLNSAEDVNPALLLLNVDSD